jgi:superfamily II DNA or RNA helicase
MKQTKVEPRRWQIEAEAAERQYHADGGTKALLAACPGAGKTEYGVRAACNFFNEQGGQLVIVVAPTVNIKLNWYDAFLSAGFKVTADVQNAVIRDRLEAGHSISEDFEVICITYDQLSSALFTTKAGWSLFSVYCQRMRTMIIGDEIHHADDQAAYGAGLRTVSDYAARRLALSGTPFKTDGGALSMCESDIGIDENGRPVRRVKPFYDYSYGQALNDGGVCRSVEFGIVYGRAKCTYASLLTGDTFEKVISGHRRDDSLEPLLDPDGDYLPTLLDEGLARLDALRAHHRNAAMLVVAMDHDHAGRITAMLKDRCQRRYNVQLLLHDTERVHDRISSLERDNTDIVVTVRMISEGIDVKRFRVGVFATNWKTQLFFIQFIGRFLRWQNELGDGQHAWVIFPGHVLLVEFAQKIEEMIRDSVLAIGGENGGGGNNPSSMRTGNETEATKKETMEHGRTLESDDESMLAAFFQDHPDVRGKGSDSFVADILRRAHYQGVHTEARERGEKQELSHKYWRQQNAKAAKLVARLIQKSNPDNPEALFAKVNGRANREADIAKVDALVPLDVLQRRYTFLKVWAQQLMNGIDPEDFDG